MIALGIVFVLMLGEIDLSVGAVAGLAGAVMVVLNVKQGWTPDLAIAAAVAFGAAIGTAQGFLFSRFGVPSFVVTLGGLFAWQGESMYRCSASPAPSTSPIRRSPVWPTSATEHTGSIIAIVASDAYGRCLRSAPRRVAAGPADNGPIAQIARR